MKGDGQTRILGYLEVGDTALCVSCADDAYYINTALGNGIIRIIRHEHVQNISFDLQCVRCTKIIAMKGGE
jgi:hypothetical protein